MLVSGPAVFHAVVKIQIFLEFTLAILGIISAFLGGIAAGRTAGIITSGQCEKQCNEERNNADFFHGKSFFLVLSYVFSGRNVCAIDLFCLPFSVIAVNKILNFGIAEITVMVGTAASAAVGAAGIVTAGQCQKQSEEESDDTYFFHGDAFFLYYYRRRIPPARGLCLYVLTTLCFTDCNTW